MESPRIPQPKIILEGTHLTRKTDIAFALAEHPRIIGERKHRWHIPLVSSEWDTFSDEQPTKANPGRSMIEYEPYQETRDESERQGERWDSGSWWKNPGLWGRGRGSLGSGAL